MKISKDQKQFLSLKLSDRTGTINGYIWDNASDVADLLHEKSYVKVKGVSTVVNSSLFIKIAKIRPANSDEIDIEDFLEVVPGGIELWHEKLLNVSYLVEDINCRMLIDSFLYDDIFMQSFLNAIGGTKIHHNYIGGLLQHTISTMELASHFASDNSGPVNKDLLITGAFLHDIGKTKEMRWEPVMEYTDEGRLIGHITLGILMFKEKVAEIQDFPKELEMLLLHLMLSHHGKREYGSPVVPATPEAIMLNLIDGADARLNHIYCHMESCDPNSSWSSYDKYLHTAIYQKKFLSVDAEMLSEAV